MGLPEMWEAYPGVFDGNVLNNLTNVDLSPEIADLMITPAGSVDPAFVGSSSARFSAQFTSLDVATILGFCPLLTGLSVSTLAKMQFEQGLDGGMFASGSNHMAVSSTKGKLLIDEISATQSPDDGKNDPAQVSARYYALYDGTNAPATVATGLALTGSPAVNAIHTLGPVNYEGASGGMKGVTRVSFKTGLEYVMQQSDGEPWPRVGRIRKRAPSLEIEGLNLSLATGLNLNQPVPLVSGITLFLQKCIVGGGKTPYGTSGHISIAITRGSYKLTRITGQGGGNSLVTIVVTPYDNLATYIATNANTTIVLA